jgi:hypothetical protein
MRQVHSFVALVVLSSFAAAAGVACGPDPKSDVSLSYEETVAPVDGTAPKTLTVITAAAQCPISTDCSRSWTDAFVKNVFQDHDPDVVIMTEMFWNGTYRNTVDQVNKVRPNVYNFYRGPKEGFIDGSGGTVIASKFPMTDKAEHEYDNCLHPDCEVDKGTAVARQHLGKLADGREITLDVVATHFQAKTVGDLVGVIGEQMGEQRDFLRGYWRDPAHDPTLKIYSGDLNCAGDGPSWLATGGHSGADSRGRDRFHWLRDNVLLGYGLRDGMDACAAGAGNAKACASRDFREVETGDVIKQMYTPAGGLRTPDGATTLDTIFLVPESVARFSTPSDHEAKLVKYGLYVKRGTFVVEVHDGGAPAPDAGGHPREDGGGGAPAKDGCDGRAEGTYCSSSDPTKYYRCIAGDTVPDLECAAGTRCVQKGTEATCVK